MIRLLAFIVLFATVADAQSLLQFRRGTKSALPTGAAGEPLFVTDSVDLYMGSDSGTVLIGGRSVVYGKATFATDAGSTDAYAITLVPAPTKYWNGMRISFRANTANTGSATLNVNSLGAKTIYTGALAGDTLITGDISADDVVTVVFADSAFYLQSARPTSFYETQNYFMVPSVPGWVFTGASSSTGFTQALNDSIFVWGQYLPAPVKLGKVAFYTGSLTGSSPVRTVSVAVYNYAKTLVDSTSATQYVASDVFPITFSQGATVGPGWVFFAFSVYFSSTGTFRFNVAAADVSYATAAILSGQSATYPIVGTASNKLSAGVGWPSTITVSRLTSSFQLPVMHIWGTDVD